MEGNVKKSVELIIVWRETLKDYIALTTNR